MLLTIGHICIFVTFKIYCIPKKYTTKNCPKIGVKQISMRKLESYNTKKEKEGAFHQENKTQMKSGERHTLKVLLFFFFMTRPCFILIS